MLSGEIKTTKTRIDGTLSVMKDQLPLMGDINPQERVVFFNNGVLNLDTFELQSHDVKFKNSRYIDVDYSEEFEAPIWDNWLKHHKSRRVSVGCYGATLCFLFGAGQIIASG